MNTPRFSTLLLTTFILWALGYALWVTNYLLAPFAYMLNHSLRGIFVFALGVVLCLAIGRMLAWAQGRRSTGLMVVVADSVLQ